MRNMYFIGVTTGQSAMRRIFPHWLRIAGLEPVELIGVDLPVGTGRETYREVVERIRDDEASYGALITTHKVGIFERAGDLFDGFAEDARLLGEVGCIVRRDSRLRGSALDYACSGAALAQIVPPAEMDGRHVLILGAGGAGTALAAYVSRHFAGCRLHATDLSPARLDKIRALSGAETWTVNRQADNDAILARMPDRTIVVNATGLGKDLPGSPISANAVFPVQSVAWEFNYRGDLQFLANARRFPIVTADGWDYFLRGWSSTMAQVLDFEVTEERMEAFRRVAAAERL